MRLRRVGEANGSRERAPDDKLRAPTTTCNGGHGTRAPLPTLRLNRNPLLVIARSVSDEAIHSSSCPMDCFAEPVIGSAFALPVGSQ
jgi:hypothetical protein